MLETAVGEVKVVYVKILYYKQKSCFQNPTQLKVH